MLELEYRRSLVRKHMALARVMKAKGLHQDMIAREVQLARFMWRQYRRLVIPLSPVSG